MKKPEEMIRAKLWAQMEPHFERAVAVLLESKQPKAKKLQLARDIAKTAYLAGLDRGFDMGYTVFGDGSDDDDDVHEEER